jgi:alpha-D-ribose 1-methylphosphonate 5-triphosphate synthase subunit PhnI
MGYVAVKGGREAIENAARFLKYERVKGRADPIAVRQILEQLHLAVDRVMSEGSLYAPELGALAVKQSAGDTLEASFLLRAYRTTQPRIGYSVPCRAEHMRVVRRISAAFKEIPGGQVLGPTSDYTLRLLDFDLLDEPRAAWRAYVGELLGESAERDELDESFAKVVEVLRREGLLVQRSDDAHGDGAEVCDVTRESPVFPAPRSAALQTLARGETGGLLCLAYSNMRGYGMVHPTVGELRVGYLPLLSRHPYTDEVEFVGEVKVTEAEVISKMKTSPGDELPVLTLGYGLCFGHNETKAISMAVLDRAMQSAEPSAPSEDQEFVLQHVDGIEAMGFCNHYKLPHYVTFQSELDRLRKARGRAAHESAHEREAVASRA